MAVVCVLVALRVCLQVSRLERVDGHRNLGIMTAPSERVTRRPLHRGSCRESTTKVMALAKELRSSTDFVPALK